MSEASDRFPDETVRRLLQVARELSASADLEQILSRIIDSMRDLLDAERATVFEYDVRTDELFTTVAHGLAGDSGATEIRFPAAAGLAGESARTRAIINVPDAHADSRFNAEIDRKTGYRTRSLLTIPLEGHEHDLVGVAQILNKRGGPFTRHDEQIATALAAQAAVALRRGRLIEDRMVREKLERDLQIVREIQQGSFPKTLPSLDGFDTAAWSEPAEETGGDAYDVVGLPRPGGDRTGAGGEAHGAAERAVFLLADATGHGVGPALAVTELRSMLRMAVRMQADLAALAEHVNRQLCHDLPPGRFITAWLAELDVPRARLRSFSAGQGPLLHYVRADDAFLELGADAVPLGIMDDLEVTPSSGLLLQPGDLFVTLSDGIFEAMSPTREQFGSARARDVIRAARDGTADAIATAIRDAVTRFTEGRPADDDRTGIIIKRLGA